MNFWKSGRWKQADFLGVVWVVAQSNGVPEYVPLENVGPDYIGGFAPAVGAGNIANVYRVIAGALATSTIITNELNKGDNRAGRDWQKREAERARRAEMELIKLHNLMIDNGGLNTNPMIPGIPPGGGAAILFGTLKVFELYLDWLDSIIE